MTDLALEHDEFVQREIRRHWFTLVLDALPLVLLALLPLLLPAFANYLKLPLPAIPHLAPLLAVLYSFWLLFLWLIFFIRWTIYYLDVWVITNKRLIDINQKWFFNREVLNCRLDRVQDIYIDVRGLLPTLIGYGDIRVETASESGSLVLKTCAHPEKIRQLIADLHDQAAEAPQAVHITDTPDQIDGQNKTG